MLKPPLRDPALPARLLAVALGLVAVAASFPLAGFNPARLFDAGTLGHLARFVADFFPPAHDTAFLHELLRETLTTLAVASCGLALAVFIGAPAALLSCRALERAYLADDAPSPPAQALAALLRAVLVLLRGVPDLVWALLFVRAAGLGSLPAVLALGLAYGGMLGKVYAEILEAQPQDGARALALSGARRHQWLLWALAPQALPEIASYTVYRWECAIRASAVMGFVGAGGLGLLLDTSIKMMNGGEVGTLLLLFVLLVALTELVSRLTRWLLERRAGTPQALALMVLTLTASVAWLLPGWRESGFDAAALPGFVAGFFPAELPDGGLPALAQASGETLAMSLLGTLLAAVAGALLALPAAGRLGRSARAASRLLLAVLRGVPDLLWAALAVLAAGLGPAAGVLALALHTAGVLGRLFAEAVENAPREPELALAAQGAGHVAAFCYGLMPGVLAQWLSYTLYRWENNIRIAAVLGIVGAGGLGQQLYLALSLFQEGRAAALIAAMLALSWAVERLSAWLRRRLAG